MLTLIPGLFQRLEAEISRLTAQADGLYTRYTLQTLLIFLIGVVSVYVVVATVLWQLGFIAYISPLTSGLLLPFFWVGLWLIRRDRFRAAAYVCILAVFGCIGLVMAFWGVSHSLVLGLTLVTILAGLSLGGRAAAAFFVAGMAVYATVVHLEQQGIFPLLGDVNRSFLQEFLDLGTMMGSLVLFIWFSTQKLKRAWESESALVAQLQDKQDELESQVVERAKELATLQRLAELLRDTECPLDELFQAIVAAVRGGLYDGESRGVSLSFDDISVRQPAYQQPTRVDRVDFTAVGKAGFIEAVYLRPFGTPADRTHIVHEQTLLHAVAAYLTLYLGRRAALTSLAHSNKTLTALFQAAPVGIVVLDGQQGHVTMWNPAAERIFGWKAEEVLGQPSPVIPPDKQKEFRELLARASQGESLQNLELVRQRRDGSTVIIQLSTATITNPVTGSSEIIAIVSDITGQKRYERELQEALQAAEAATRAKSAFIANMSHEIRTPLNAIVGMSTLLRDSRLTAEQKSQVALIRQSSDLLLSLINDILDLSKLEAGQLELELRPFAVLECVEQVIELFAWHGAEKGIELFYQVAPETPAQVVGDMSRIQQVLVNLLNNAIKFTEHGEILVSAEVRLAEAPQSPQLHIAVRDSGIGIPAERIPELFEPFTQLDSSTTRRYGGAGLGLAICRYLTQQMGGRIQVESVPGQGSTFHFCVPVRVADARPAQAYPPLAEQDKTVLIWSHASTGRQLLQDLCRRWGLEALAPADEAEAVALLTSGRRLDLCLVDLPAAAEATPSAILAAIQKRWPHLATIFLHPVHRPHQNFKAEHLAIVSKPVKYGQLHQVCRRLLTRRPEEAEPLIGVIGQTSRHCTSLRILLVEDNLVNQKVALNLLRRLDCSADVAANGLEALEALSRQSYDVVLMDIMMPEMDGLEATRRIRQEWPAERQPCIIALTANTQPEDRTRCMEAGMNAFLSKPIRVEQLQEVLQAYCQGQLTAARRLS
ncbi:MAG: hypothetical protein KatS3mg050_4701 [Litorilinea sp.]|nr:MAG: hypothetical protein KatS3mg050_4701 [Litorilinea sp.]